MKTILLRIYAIILFFTLILTGIYLMFIGAIILGPDKTILIERKISKHLNNCMA